MSFPAALHVYWSGSSLMSLIQFLIVRSKPVAKLVALEPLPPLSQVVGQSKPQATEDPSKLTTHKKRKK
jgi:membrane protein insertase Oxa1/YidC/SpoIIIJ